ncbi:DinB family protein, partial [Bacillus sp. B-TM1]
YIDLPCFQTFFLIHVTICFPFVGKLETSILELVQHVVNHGTYHRGNITAMIRQLGHSSTMMDFVLYLHMVKKQGE